MGYVQMTLDDWMRMKDSLKQDIRGAKEKWNGLKCDFVRIGYKLRKIEGQKLYEMDGYKSLAEFAKAECGLTASDVTRSMQINKRYSVGGYSEEIRPEFLEYGNSKLTEMLALPDEDLGMVRPETPREDIRELKRFNKTEPAAGVADDIRQLIEKFFKDNPDTLNAVFSEPGPKDIKRLVEIVNPGGNRSYKKGLFFLMMYENKVAVKKFGSAPQEMPWEEFARITAEIFGDAAGSDTWQNYFGEGEQEMPAMDGKGGAEAVPGQPEKTEEKEADIIAPAQKTPEILEAEAPGQEEKHAGNPPKSSEMETLEPGKADFEEEKAAPDDNFEEKEAGEEIAPAQNIQEILEEEAGNGDGSRELETYDKADGAAGNACKPETKEASGGGTEEGPSPAAVNPPEVTGKPFGSRKDYLGTLSVHEAASYMAGTMKEIGEDNRKPESIIFWGRWLSQDVDVNGNVMD